MIKVTLTLENKFNKINKKTNVFTQTEFNTSAKTEVSPKTQSMLILCVFGETSVFADVLNSV